MQTRHNIRAWIFDCNDCEKKTCLLFRVVRLAWRERKPREKNGRAKAARFSSPGFLSVYLWSSLLPMLDALWAHERSDKRKWDFS